MNGNKENELNFYKNVRIKNTTYTNYEVKEVIYMLAMLLNEIETKEMQYLLKREMDEILFDLKDERIHVMVKSEMEERYKHLFTLFKRVASPSDCIKYMRKNKKIEKRTNKIIKSEKSY
jgi:hypothetical protein